MGAPCSALDRRTALPAKIPAKETLVVLSRHRASSMARLALCLSVWCRGVSAVLWPIYPGCTRACTSSLVGCKPSLEPTPTPSMAEDMDGEGVQSDAEGSTFPPRFCEDFLILRRFISTLLYIFYGFHLFGVWMNN